MAQPTFSLSVGMDVQVLLTIADWLKELGMVDPRPREETEDFVLYLADTVALMLPRGAWKLYAFTYRPMIPQMMIAMRVSFSTASERVFFFLTEKLFCFIDVSNDSNAPAEQTGDFFLSIWAGLRAAWNRWMSKGSAEVSVGKLQS